MQSEVLQTYSDRGIELLNEYEARQVLKEYDIPCPTGAFVPVDEFDDGTQFHTALEAMGETPTYPLYLKAVSRDISSISDVGGVKRARRAKEVPDLVDGIRDGVEKAAPGTDLQGILATEDVSGEARELLLGASVDPQFGNVISLGIGGIYVEVYGDVEFRPLPVAPEDVQSMIDGLHGRGILEGFRGMAPADREALVDVTVRFARLIEENPEIREADINPLMVRPDGVVAADALFRLP